MRDNETLNNSIVDIFDGILSKKASALIMAKKIPEKLIKGFSNVDIDFKYHNFFDFIIRKTLISSPGSAATCYGDGINELSKAKMKISHKYISDLALARTKQEKIDKYFEFLHCILHEISHVNLYHVSKKESSVSAFKYALSSVAVHYDNGRKNYYSENHDNMIIENMANINAYSNLIYLLEKFFIPRYSNEKSTSADDLLSNSTLTFLIHKKDIYTNIVLSHFLNTQSYTSFMNEKNLVDINDSLFASKVIKENPKFLEMYSVLNHKYNSDGSERNLKNLVDNYIKLKSDPKFSQINSIKELTNLNEIFNELNSNKIKSAKAEERSEDFNLSKKENKQKNFQQSSLKNDRIDILYSIIIFQKIATLSNEKILEEKQDLSKDEKQIVEDLLNLYKSNFVLRFKFQKAHLDRNNERLKNSDDFNNVELAFNVLNGYRDLCDFDVKSKEVNEVLENYLQ